MAGGGQGGNNGATNRGTHAGGGSGWVFTEANFNAGFTSSVNTGGTWLLDSEYFLAGASTIAGEQSMPMHAGAGNMTGNAGNGHARITFVSTIIETNSEQVQEEVEEEILNEIENEGSEEIEQEDIEMPTGPETEDYADVDAETIEEYAKKRIRCTFTVFLT